MTQNCVEDSLTENRLRTFGDVQKETSWKPCVFALITCLKRTFFLSASCNQTNRYQYIFRYLSVPETSGTLSKCCRSWRHACTFSLPGFRHVLLDLRSNLCRDLNEFWMSNRRWRGVFPTSSIPVLLISTEADKLQTFINSQRKLFPCWGFSAIFT